MAGILVPLDGSTLAERALPWAAAVARATGGQIRLVEAISNPVTADFVVPLDELQAGASEYLNDQAEQIERNYGVAAMAITSMGPAPEVILAQASSGSVGYVAMSTHARDGLRRAVLGSVAEHVLRESPVPVYLLPAAAQGRALSAIKSIAIPLDGSALSQAILEPAALLARQLGATITLIRVYEPPDGAVFDEHGSMVRSVDQEVDRIELLAAQYMGPLTRQLQRLGIEANTRWELGHEPADHIVRLADLAEADLIVMATHGRSGLDRLRHGSVTEKVLRHSHIPLLAFGRIPLKSLVAAEAQAPARSVKTAKDVSLNPAVQGVV